MNQAGKLNILLDGQFGSTGKGLFAAYIATNYPADIYLSSLSPNAGHTFPFNGEHVVTKQLPVGGILNDCSTIYLTAGSIIDPEKLAAEVEKFGVTPDRLFIHPRAAIIERCDVEAELNPGSSVAAIASTQSGVGEALVRKIQRRARLADDIELLHEIATVQELDIMQLLDHDATAFMETSQGFGLSLDSGFSYPHCTSREITVQASLSAAQVHPSYLGDVSVCLRAYPIRVGHLLDEDGQKIGDSGPFYPDGAELGWDDLQVEPEKTTVTGRVRRIAQFSIKQYSHMLHHIRPDYVFVNFVNYTRFEDLETYRQMFCVRVPDFVGVGRGLHDIYSVRNHDEAMDFFKMAAGEKQRGLAGLTPRNIMA